MTKVISSDLVSANSSTMITTLTELESSSTTLMNTINLCVDYLVILVLTKYLYERDPRYAGKTKYSLKRMMKLTEISFESYRDPSDGSLIRLEFNYA